MFPTPRSRALLSYAVLALVAAGCSENAAKSRDADAAAAGTTSAGAAGAANEGGAAGAETEMSAGSAATDDSSYAGSGGEDGECHSGQTRCHGQLGFQRCTPAGVWGTSQSCGGYSDNGTSSYCAVVDDGGGPWAACVDPACWWWLQTGSDLSDGRAGVCVGSDKVRSCLASVLSTPEPCDGVCRRVAELDGRVLGYCDAACTEGDRECLSGSLFRVCEQGRWKTRAESCPDSGLCQPLATGAHPDIKCGGACEAGTARCSEDGTGVETCGTELVWQSGAPCMLGRCVQSGAQAECQTECKPGERACAFDGALAELECSDQGLWMQPSACATGSTCRIGTAGALGCVTCVGPALVGGNAWGVADSRCDGPGVAQCNEQNELTAAEPCSVGLVCVEVTRGAATLGYCK